jgi:hypothetical protein
MRLWLVCILAVLLLSVVALGDVVGHHPVRRPRQSGKTMVVQVDPNATAATLKIPRPMLKQFLAESGPIDGGDSERAGDNAVSSVRTVAAGIFLSLAAIAAGLSFWRFRGRGSKGRSNRSARQAAGLTGAVIFVALGSWLATASRADVRVPPSRTTAPLILALPDGGPVTGLVNIEIVSDGDQITLSVPAPKANEND